MFLGKNVCSGSGNRIFAHWLVFLLSLICWGTAYAAWICLPHRETDMTVIEQLTELGAALYRAEYDIRIYLLGGVLAVFAAVLANCLVGRSDSKLAAECENPQLRVRWIDGLVLFGICSLVFVSDPAIIAERCFEWDGFHHLNYYLMGPLQAYRHGAAIGTQVYSQYESGWVLLFAAISKFTTVDHTFALGLFSGIAGLYFCGVYALVRQHRVGVVLGVACVALCIYCNLFSPGIKTPWLWVSSTMLRCPLDILIALVLPRLVDGNRLAVWPIVGGLTGASVLFGTDTGIYIAVAMFVVSALLGLQHRQSNLRRTCFSLLLLWASAAVTLLAGLWIAGRGTLLESSFWTGYFEVLFLYPSGFSAHPLSEILSDPFVAVLLFVVLMTYTVTLGGVFSRCFLGRACSDDLAKAFLATVGFGLLMVFINRSLRPNLFHPIIPACVLITIAASKFLQEVRSGNREVFKVRNWALDAESTVGTIMLAGIAMVMIMNANFRGYPSLLRSAIKPQLEISARLSQAIREIHDADQELKELAGPRNFAIVGEDVTLWLVTLDLAPNGRYCPSFMATLSQKRSVLESIDGEIILVTAPHMYGIREIEDYVSVDRVCLKKTELYAIYARPDGAFVDGDAL
jgi:hypothetical protein